MWVLNVLTAAGQESVTKSGTQVTPADRLRATPLLLQKSAASPDNNADPLAYETQDVEIQDFVNRLKRRKRMRRLASWAVMAVAAIAALLVFAWLVGAM